MMKQTLLILLGFIPIVLSRPENSQSLGGGAYSFAYDTNTGGFHSQSGSPSGTSGKYGFNTGEGTLNVEFSGGGGGAPPPIESYAAPSGGNGGGKGTYSLNLNPDGSYSYTYDLDDQGKSENRKTDGEVDGQFYFTGKDGQKKSIQYTAGRGGFQPTGDHIPKADDAPSGGLSAPYSPYSGGNGDTGTLQLNLQPGGDYSYSYNLKDQAKSESGSGGKVKGQFSFTAPDGQSRAIKYTADEGGFQPEGDHLPKPVEPLPVPSNDGGSLYDAGSPAGGDGSYSYSYNANEHAKSESGGGGGPVSGQYSVSGPGNSQSVTYTANGGYNPIVEARTTLGGGNGGGGSYSAGLGGGAAGSYSFNYAANEHNRAEQGRSGDVSGKYSVQSLGGDQQSSYTAGKKGFLPIHSIKIKLG